MNNTNENNEKILAIFHNKCEELGLWYSLSNLSLLKTKSDAVKNDNNIVEVMMKIEDYNQFLKVNHDHLIDNLTRNDYYYTSPFFFIKDLSSIIKINLIIRANVKKTEKIYTRKNLLRQKIGYYKSIKKAKNFISFWNKLWFGFFNLFYSYLTWYEISSNIYDNENFQGYFVVDSFQLNVNLNWIPSLTMKRIPVQYGNITTYLPEEWEVLLIKRYGADWKENPILERKMKFNFIFDDFIKH